MFEKLCLCSKVLYDEDLLDMSKRLYEAETLIQGYDSVLQGVDIESVECSSAFISRRNNIMEKWKSFCYDMAHNQIEDLVMWLNVFRMLEVLMKELVDGIIPERWFQPFVMHHSSTIQRTLEMVAKNVAFCNDEHFSNAMYKLGCVQFIRLEIRVKCEGCGNPYLHLETDAINKCDECR
jgi:hypothetical protein